MGRGGRATHRTLRRVTKGGTTNPQPPPDDRAFNGEWNSATRVSPLSARPKNVNVIPRRGEEAAVAPERKIKKPGLAQPFSDLWGGHGCTGPRVLYVKKLPLPRAAVFRFEPSMTTLMHCWLTAPPARHVFGRGSAPVPCVSLPLTASCWHEADSSPLQQATDKIQPRRVRPFLSADSRQPWGLF